MRIYREPGFVFTPLRRGSDRAGAVLAVGDSREQALARADRAASAIAFHVAPTGDAEQERRRAAATDGSLMPRPVVRPVRVDEERARYVVVRRRRVQSARVLRRHDVVRAAVEEDRRREPCRSGEQRR